MKLRPEEITSILRQRIEVLDVDTTSPRSAPSCSSATALPASTGSRTVVALEMLELDQASSASPRSPSWRDRLTFSLQTYRD